MLKAFEKHPILWDVKKRVFNKNLLQKAYEEITIEVNENKEYNIKWEEARKRIRQMRFDYSVELEKQRKGQEHEIPWYWEHMKYLEENIEVLLKGRVSNFGFKFKFVENISIHFFFFSTKYQSIDH